MKTTMIYLRQLLVLFTVLLAFSACGDDKDEVTGGDITLVTPADKAIVCNGDKNDPISITFTATGNWTARPSHGWLSLSKMTGGAGDHTIILVVSDNDNYDKVRVGTITITDKNSQKSVDITVTQGKKDGILTFSSDSQDGMDLTIYSDEKDSENNKIEGTVNVTSNYDYSIRLDKEWLGYRTDSNDDGSTKITFRVTDYDKLYADGGYGEQTCNVSFAYASETRAPGLVTYKIKFPGITPYVKFYVSSEEDDEAVSSIELEEGDYSYKEGDETKTLHTYLKSAVFVKSNIAWQDIVSDKFIIEYNGGANNSTTFFESNTSIKIVLKEMTLEDVNENLPFTDANNSQTSLESLNIKVPGLGENYVYLDWTVFQPIDQITNHFMFEAEGEYGMPIQKEFVVKTTSPGKEKVYMLHVDPNSHYSIAGVWKEEVTWINELWGPEGEYEGEGALKSGNWLIKLPARGSDDSDQTPAQPRFFALVAVPNSITLDDLFDSEDYLKEEYESNCIILGQKGKVEELTFSTEDVELDGTINVSPSGETITINYISNAPIGISGFIQDVEGSVELPYDYDWKELDNSIFPKLDFAEGKIEITVSKNETGEKREIRCGLTAYEPDSEEELDCLLFTFKIVQEPLIK